MADAPTIIPADSPLATQITEAPAAAQTPVSIPGDSPLASQITDKPAPDGVPATLPADAPVQSQDDYLKQLPRDEIVREYRKSVASGQNPDKEAFYRAYEARVHEGNLFGDKDRRPDITPQPSFFSKVLDVAKSIDEGMLSQGNEAGKFLFGRDVAGSRGNLSDVERKASAANLIQGSELAALRTANTLRQFAVNTANYVLHHNNFVASSIGSPREEMNARDSALFREQFDTDAKVQDAEDRVASGKSLFTEAHLRELYPTPQEQAAHAAATNKLFANADPAAISAVAQSPLSDPSFVLPFALAGKTAAVGKAAQAFKTLDTVPVRMLEGTKVFGPLSETLARPIELAANGVRAATELTDKSPLVRAGIAGAATLAVGGSAPQAILAGLLGESIGKAELVSKALAGTENALRTAAGKVAGRIPLGPYSGFAAKTFAQATEEGKALLLSQAPNLPFLLGSENRKDAENFAIVGMLAHGAGKGAGMAASGLNVARNFFAPFNDVGEPRLPTKDLGVSPTLDAEHAKTMSGINDAGSNFVEGWRNFLKKAGIGETYVVSPDGFRAALDEIAATAGVPVESLLPPGVSPDRAAQQRGLQLDVPMPEGKTRRVALIAAQPGVPGLAAGHEIAHMIFKGLSDEQQSAVRTAIARDYGPDQVENFRRKYAQDLGVKESEISATEAVDELAAEAGSGLLNSVPISHFGPAGSKTWGSTVRKIYGVIGTALSNAGFSVPEAAQLRAIESADGSVAHIWEGVKGSGPRTALGAQPSIAGARLIENYLQAMSLDKDVFRPETGVNGTESTPAAVSPIADTRVIPPEPRFKKDDVLGQVHGSDGTLIAEDAKIVKLLGDRDGVHYYEIHYTDPADGLRKSGSVPESYLYSPNKAAKGATPVPQDNGMPKHPVTAESPVGATPGEPVRPSDTVTPRQIENVARPEATPLKNVHVTPAQQEAFAQKATPEVIKENIAVAQKADTLPTHQKQAYETEYYSAKGETGEDASVREQRRKLADKAEKTGKPNPLRAIYQKIFVPYRYVPGKTPRVFGFSYDKLIQNVDVLKGWAAANKRADLVARLSDSQFANTVRKYLTNQSHGYGGDGKLVTLPSDTKPGSITPRDPNFKPTKLSPADTQLVNLLMGIELPQNSSPASRFSARMARENGLTPTMNNAGVEITNPLYSELTGEGLDPKLLNSVVENLPIDRMTTPLKPRPDVSFPAGDVGLTRAGFLPGAAPRGASPELPEPKLGSFLERVSAPRAPEDEFSRHSSFVEAPKGGVILHSAKLRSTGYLNAEEAKAFREEIDSAPTQKAKDRIIESHFLPAEGTQTWNIGLNVTDKEPNTVEHVLSTLKAAGIEPDRYEVKQSGTEPTLVAQIPKTDDATVAKISDALSQDAIAVQNPDGSGKLLGPRAAAWGDFNPEFFLPLSEKAAANFLPAPPVESEAFKKWFGKSEVVDAKGDPLVVYHGTPRDFTVFDPSKASYSKWNGFGSWFTNDKEYAAKFGRKAKTDGTVADGNLVEAYVSLKEPAIYTGDGKQNGFERLMEDFTTYTGKKTYEATPEDAKVFRDHLQSIGFDGIVVKNFTGDAGLSGGRPVDLFVALEPTQVKSAKQNSGEFDSTNPDIHFLPAAPVQHAGKPLPESLGNETLNLVHFGGTGLKSVDPRNFGKSGLTTRSELSGQPRSYFYVQDKVNQHDPVATRPNQNGAKVSAAKIYDGDTDALNYASQINREKADQMLRDAGYVGISRSRGKYQQIELFEPTAVRPLASASSKFLPQASPKQESAFKDSKVRDAEGHLLPVFHGTYSDFKKFKKGDLGYHFGTPEAASARVGHALREISPDFEGGNAEVFNAYPEIREGLPPAGRRMIDQLAHGVRMLPVFLDIKNPLRMPDVGPWDDPELVLADLPKSVKNKFTASELKGAEEEGLKPIQNALKRLGYDGIVYENTHEGSEDMRSNQDYEDSYIAFDNAQIMPAFAQDAKARFLPGKPKEGAKEWITSAVLETGEGKRVLGKSHADALDKITDNLGNFPFIDRMGFVTNLGHFLDREEAYKLAADAGQIDRAEYEQGLQVSESRPIGMTSEKFRENAKFMPKVAVPGAGLVDPRETRTYKNLAKYLTPGEADKIRKDTAQKMLDLYKELPADEDFETASKAGSIKKGWYKRAADSLQFIFGEDTDRFVGLVAAMSPQQSVQENLRMSLATWADWQDAGRPLDTDALTEIVERHADIHARVPNSVRALQGYTGTVDELNKAIDPNAKLSGFKVESFRRNLLGNLEPSTNDTWMANFGNIDQSQFGTKSGYLAYNAKIRKVADKLNLKPAEVQETVWSFFKTLTEATTVDPQKRLWPTSKNLTYFKPPNSMNKSSTTPRSKSSSSASDSKASIPSLVSRILQPRVPARSPALSPTKAANVVASLLAELPTAPKN